MSNLQNEGKMLDEWKCELMGQVYCEKKIEKEIVTYCDVNHQISGVSVVEVHSQGLKRNWC